MNTLTLEKSTENKIDTSYLMDHQRAALQIARERKRWGFFFDTGTGKTLLGIEIVKLHGIKTLVICPLSIINSAWMEDIRKWAPELEPYTVNLWELWRKKKSFAGQVMYDTALDHCKIALINYESFKIQQAYLERHNFGQVLLDESSKVKNNKAQVTKLITKFCERVPYTYLFSGTPAPNSLLEYFPQIRIIDKDLFGRKFYTFRNMWFNSTGYGGYTYTIKPELEEIFLQKLRQASSVVRKQDVLDLPERTFNIRYVELSSEEWRVYNRMKRDFLVEIEEKEYTAQNAAVKLMKLREVTSGFIMGDEGYNQFGESKLKELKNLLEEIGNHQVIIWFQFHKEVSSIATALFGKMVSWGRVDGTIPQSLKDETLQNFKNGKLQYLLAHPKSVGHGHTLVNCNYSIYYSLSYSLEEHIQSQDRIYRKGQRNQCTYYYLLAKDSIDEAIYAALKMKGDVSRTVLEFIKGGGKHDHS